MRFVSARVLSRVKHCFLEFIEFKPTWETVLNVLPLPWLRFNAKLCGYCSSYLGHFPLNNDDKMQLHCVCPIFFFIFLSNLTTICINTCFILKAPT